MSGPPIELPVFLEHPEDRRLHPDVWILDVDAGVDVVGSRSLYAR